MALASWRRVGLLKSDLSYGLRRVESRAFSNAATGIANRFAGSRFTVACRQQ